MIAFEGVDGCRSCGKDKLSAECKTEIADPDTIKGIKQA